MIYNILTKLFKWRWVLVYYGYTQHVRRIRVTSEGEEYVMCYGQYLFLNERHHRKL